MRYSVLVIVPGHVGAARATARALTMAARYRRHRRARWTLVTCRCVTTQQEAWIAARQRAAAADPELDRRVLDARWHAAEVRTPQLRERLYGRVDALDLDLRATVPLLTPTCAPHPAQRWAHPPRGHGVTTAYCGGHGRRWSRVTPGVWDAVWLGGSVRSLLEYALSVGAGHGHTPAEAARTLARLATARKDSPLADDLEVLATRLDLAAAHGEPTATLLDNHPRRAHLPAWAVPRLPLMPAVIDRSGILHERVQDLPERGVAVLERSLSEWQAHIDPLPQPDDHLVWLGVRG